MELPCEMLESWVPTISYLELRGLRNLKNLPMLIDCLAKSSTHLTYLSILGVPKLMADSIGSVESWDLSSLRSLEIDVSVEWSRKDSVGIAETVEGMLRACSNSVTWLEVKGVENWEWLPQSIQHLTVVYSLELENVGIEELPQWLGNLSSLKELNIYSCNSLLKLILKGMENWEWLPQSIQYLTSVSILSLENIGVEELPQWLGNLSSLKRLFLRNCSKLKRLPSMDALKSLFVNDFPELRIDSEWRNHHRHLEIWVDV